VPTSLSFSPSKTGVRAARSTSTTRPSCLRGSSDHRGGHLPLATRRHPRRRPPPELSAARPSPWRPRRAGGRSRRRAELVGEVTSGGPGQHEGTKARRHEGTKGLTWSPRTGPVAWSDQVPVPTSLSFSPSKTGVRAARSTSTTRPSCLRGSSDRPTGRGVVESFGGGGAVVAGLAFVPSCLRAFVPSWFVRSPRWSPPAGDPTPPPPPTTPRAQRRSTVTVASTSRRREVAPSGRAGGGGDLWGAGPARRHEGTKARRHEGPHVVAADRSSGVERPGSGADVAVVLTLEDRGEGCAVDLDHQAFVPSWFVRSPRGSPPAGDPPHPRRRPPPELSAARPSPWRPRRRRAGGRSRRQAELVGEVTSGGPGQHEGTKARRHEGTKGLTWSPRTGPVAWSDQVPVPTSLSFSPSKTGVRAARSTSTTRPSCLRGSSERSDGARGGREFRGGGAVVAGLAFVPSYLRAFVVRPITAGVTSRWRPRATPAADHPPSSAPLDRHRGVHVDVAQAGGRAVRPSWWGR
jgi:hypothetical protein